MSNIENYGSVWAWNPTLTRTDSGPAGGFNVSQKRKDWQTDYATGDYDSVDNRNIGTKTTPMNKINPMEALIAAINKGSYGSGSGGSGSGATGLGYAELAYKKAKDAQDRQDQLNSLGYDRAKDARALSGMQDYYNSGQYGAGFDGLLKMITDQGAVSEGGITKAYDRATTNIGQGYDAASGLGTSGFNALNQYLQANPNNPYAGMTAQVGSAPDALSNYLSAYGVSDAPVQGQIQADQLQAQQGAGNFQNLTDVLSGVAQQGAASRGAESQMAQLMFDTGLGQDRAGYQSQAENAQAQALAALQQQMFQSRFGVEGDRNNLANQLAQSIISAGGDIDNNNKKKKENNDGSGPLPGQLEETATPQEIVANQLANLLAPAQAQGSSVQQLLDELNARRGR
jgi:hypothetical protein